MNTDNRIEVDLTRWGSATGREQKMFTSLIKSVISKIQIEFEYFNINDKASKLIVEPGKPVYRDKAWYLYGFCLTRNDWLLFRLTRIGNVILSDVHFNRICKKLFGQKLKIMGPS